jgi:hypothetical protein
MPISEYNVGSFQGAAMAYLSPFIENIQLIVSNTESSSYIICILPQPPHPTATELRASSSLLLIQSNVIMSESQLLYICITHSLVHFNGSIICDRKDKWCGKKLSNLKFH